MEPIRVLLVDDHSLFRNGLAALFARQREFEVVGEASDGLEAIKNTEKLKPDLVLMDISMPWCDGVEATRRIREAFPSVRVVMLTILEEDKRVFEAIKAGAHGYMLKSVKPGALFQTLQGVMRGEAAITRVTAAKILSQFSGRTPDPQGAYKEDLSAREKEVIGLVAGGLTNKEIGAKLNIAENTVKNHLKNILGKLQLGNRVQAAAFALRTGVADKLAPTE